MPSRLITNNATIAFETFHWLQQTRGGANKFMATKLDMHRVEWGFFLKWTLSKLYFPYDFINLIMNCINSVSFRFLYMLFNLKFQTRKKV